MFSLTTARCLGSCGLAPVVVLDGQVRGKATAEGVTQQVAEVLSASYDRMEEGG
jgi:bidirectional [NiFe] hydrogenase diaphorase subunit